MLGLLLSFSSRLRMLNKQTWGFRVWLQSISFGCHNLKSTYASCVQLTVFIIPQEAKCKHTLAIKTSKNGRLFYVRVYFAEHHLLSCYGNMQSGATHRPERDLKCTLLL